MKEEDAEGECRHWAVQKTRADLPGKPNRTGEGARRKSRGRGEGSNIVIHLERLRQRDDICRRREDAVLACESVVRRPCARSLPDVDDVPVVWDTHDRVRQEVGEPKVFNEGLYWA
jgi:hypothetical protein